MIALLWTALIIVGLIAALALATTLAFAQRLRAVAERVDLFLPISEGTLPRPGTPLPEFSATAVGGATVTQADLTNDRVMAFLTTDCGGCLEQVSGLRHLDPAEWPHPVVVVMGEPSQRRDMITGLGDDAVIIEQDDESEIAEAFEIHEFPAILLLKHGVIQRAGHGLAGVLNSAREPADVT